MKIIDIRTTPVTVPIEAPLRHANGCHWGRFVRTIVEVETDDGLIGLGEMGGGGESAAAAFAALKPYVLGTRSGAARGAALQDLQSDRVALQPPHADARGARVRVSRHSWASVGRACLGDPRRPAARPRAVRVVLVLSLRQRGRRQRRSAHVRAAGRAGQGAQGEARLHDAQAQGRRLPAGVRARVLSRARRGVARRPLPVRSERRLVHRAGDLVRAATSRI